MDCGAGAALGRQFAKDTLHMHANVGPGTSGNPEQDAIINEMMLQSGVPAGGDWAQQFAHQHHQHHQMAMRQQREMEEAFGTTSVTPQQAMHHHQQQQQHQHQHSQMMMNQMMMAGPMMGGFMMGGPQMMPYAPQMMMHSNPAMSTLNNINNSKNMTATATATAVEQQQQQGGNAWIEKLRSAEWAQDYSDAQVFTVEGQPEQTIEEHAKSSQFYKFMDKIRNKELLIDEENGQVVEGPGPDPELEEDTEYLKDWAAAEGINMPPGVYERMQQQQPPHLVEQLQQMHADQMNNGIQDDVVGDDIYDPNTEVEDWAKEYAEMQEQQRRAQENTDYPFEPNNPYMYHDNPMQEGIEMLQLANLAEAALAFEAVCQKEPKCEEGWRLLGTTQAENEKDALAIIALNHARMLDPKDTAVHAALAVSHTNEHNIQAALQSLRSWLLSHPQYEHLGSVDLSDPADAAAMAAGNNGDELDVTADDFFFAAPSEYRECRTLLNAAVEMNPGDAQLHASLGVLHNLSHRFDEAAANFRRAVELKPDSAELWNKLGATLANGNKPQEALDAYNRALDINPGYVRVMYNMAVSYSNMGQYQLAAKQITRAIALQSGGTQPQGDGSRMATRGLWDLLRMSLNLMDRTDLVELTWQQELGPFLKEFGLEDMMV